MPVFDPKTMQRRRREQLAQPSTFAASTQKLKQLRRDKPSTVDEQLGARRDFRRHLPQALRPRPPAKSNRNGSGNQPKSDEERNGAANAQVGVTEFIEQRDDVRCGGLVRMSFDDVTVVEVDPLQNNSKNCGGSSDVVVSEDDGSASCMRLRVTSEAIPYSVISRRLEQRIGLKHQGQIRFATAGIDFLSSSSRLVYVDHPSKEQVAAVRELALPLPHTFVTDQELCRNPTEDQDVLPDLAYGVMVRAVKNRSLRDMEVLAESLKTRGFVNYCSTVRHGQHALHSFEAAKLLLHRRYKDFIAMELAALSQASPSVEVSVGRLLQHFDSARGLPHPKDWAAVTEEIQQLEKGRLGTVLGLPCTGLYRPQLQLLKDFLARAELTRDPALLVREGFQRGVLIDKLQALSDVHFNALCSLRMKVYGHRAVVGDIVCVNRSRRWDVSDGPSDFVPGMDENLPRWTHEAPELARAGCLDELRVVHTEEEAQQYALRDVVLPKMGRVPDGVVMMEPNNRVGMGASEALAASLKVSPLTEMRLGPWATYRRVCEVPRDVSWHCWNSALGTQHGDTACRDGTYADGEGILRQVSPYSVLSGRRVPVRGGVRHGREDLVKAAAKGLTLRLCMTLPRGAAVTAALREVGAFAGIGTDTIVSMLGGDGQLDKTPRRPRGQQRHRITNSSGV